MGNGQAVHLEKKLFSYRYHKRSPGKELIPGQSESERERAQIRNSSSSPTSKCTKDSSSS